MTARMRGNMTGNAGEFSTFLKELVNTGYIKISTTRNLGKGYLRGDHICTNTL